MSDRSDDFFLPDFCSPRAVFLLVVVAELFVLVLILAWTGSGQFDWNRLALTSLFVQWIVLTSAAAICALRPLLARSSASIVTCACLAVCLAITSLFTLMATWVLDSLSPSNTLSPLSFWQEQGGQLLRNNSIALIISTIVLRYFFLQKELLRQQQAELTSRIQSLQSRIQPHFLFNSMNTIASLIASRPALAEQVVEDLADLFRASLDKATILIPLSEEIALARQYLHIESLRFGDRLTVQWFEDSVPEGVSLPRLCLQPVLENAIYHGIQPSSTGGVVEIRVQYNQSTISLTVCNTLPNGDRQPVKGNQIALKNIADRLQALYGEAAYLQTSTVQRDNQNWYKAVIRCPVTAP